MIESTHRTAEVARELRARVLAEHGLIVLTKRDLRDLTDVKRLRPSPENTGVGAPTLRTILAAASLGALPIGRETESLTGRTAPHDSDGVLGEIAALDQDDHVALFDKHSVLGRVLMLAGGAGDDYQHVALSLAALFPLGHDSTAGGIRNAAISNGGLVVVRRATLLAAVANGETEPAALANAFGAAELTPLPLRHTNLPDPTFDADVDAILRMAPDALVGVSLPMKSIADDGGLSWLIAATSFIGAMTPHAGAFAMVAQDMMFEKGPTMWSRLQQAGIR